MSTAASVMQPRIRAMEKDDLPAVVEIEQSVYDFPWTQGIFADCLNAGYLCQIYESEAGIFGYGIMSVSDGESHILNLCISQGYQGHGWGSRLLEHLLDLARRYKGRIAFLEVRVSNEHAFELYHRAGFNEIGMRKAYYPAAGGGREDAIVLAKTLT
jgi:ribosomal-protein-alanine N-acetyltransferase